MKTTLFFSFIAISLFISACGTETDIISAIDEATVSCPAKEGESHIQAVHTAEDDFCIMLHHTTHECVRTGDNRLHIYVVNNVICKNEMMSDDAMDSDTEHEMMATYNINTDTEFSTLASMMNMRSTITSATITGVDADMPAHGHGLAQDPSIDNDDASFFDINFQMPGEWVMNLEVDLTTVTDPTNVTDSTTSTSQSMSFTIEVKD